MNLHFTSIGNNFQVNFSLSDLPVEKRLSILHSLLLETGLDEALFTAFGFDEVNAIYQQATTAYQEKQKK